MTFQKVEEVRLPTTHNQIPKVNKSTLPYCYTTTSVGLIKQCDTVDCDFDKCGFKTASMVITDNKF